MGGLEHLETFLYTDLHCQRELVYTYLDSNLQVLQEAGGSAVARGYDQLCECFLVSGLGACHRLVLVEDTRVHVVHVLFDFVAPLRDQTGTPQRHRSQNRPQSALHDAQEQVPFRGGLGLQGEVVVDVGGDLLRFLVLLLERGQTLYAGAGDLRGRGVGYSSRGGWS